MKLVIGSDHAGFLLKEKLKEYLLGEGYEVEDLGTTSQGRTHYPYWALEVAKAVSSKEYDRGILICGTGIGMSIMANKVLGIRAALCHEPVSARYSRNHNDANILALGARIIGEDLALEILKVWLAAPFLGGRHQDRLHLINSWEQENRS